MTNANSNSNKGKKSGEDEELSKMFQLSNINFAFLAVLASG